MADKKIIFSDHSLSERLDKFLVRSLPALSRTQVQNLIKAGFVLVNQKKVSPHYALREKDIIEIKKLETKKLRDFLSPPFQGGASPRYQHRGRGRLINSPIGDKKVISDLKIKIIAETDDYLIINKPVGLLVHPTPVSKEFTLVDWLLKHDPRITKAVDSSTPTERKRPGIVHRLDRDVSGLLVVAKNKKMWQLLKDQFKNRQIKKEYLALVYGRLSLDEGRIERPIARSKSSGLMAAQTNKKNIAKEAITDFTVVKRYQHYTLLRLNLLTGRTHQIRVHLKSIGHSIVGDELYQTRDIRVKNNKPVLTHPFLYSAFLGFFDGAHTWQTFNLPLPLELKRFLRSLKA